MKRIRGYKMLGTSRSASSASSPTRWFSWMQTVYEPSRESSTRVRISPRCNLLDDGFQHRRVKPSLSILLVDSNRPVFEDELLPAGLLREPLSGKNRASIVLVTKCHPDMQPIDFRIYSNGLDLYPFQKLYFTSLEYGAIRPLFPELGGEELELNDLRKKHLFLVTGIASPAPLVDKLEHKTYNLYTKFFPDHHSFTKENIRSIWRMVASVDDPNKIILTTEKDAVRFQSLPFLEEEMSGYSTISVLISFINRRSFSSLSISMLETIKQTAVTWRVKSVTYPTAIIFRHRVNYAGYERENHYSEYWLRFHRRGLAGLMLCLATRLLYASLFPTITGYNMNSHLPIMFSTGVIFSSEHMGV